MKLRLKSCPRCSGDMGYDPYDEVWYCINCGRRSYMMQTLIKCKDCRFEFNPMEAEFCEECKSSICPKCGRCNCIDDLILGLPVRSEE